MKTLRTLAAAAVLMGLAACAQAPRPAPAPAPVKLAMKESVAESGAPAATGSAALYAAQCAGCHGQAGEKGLKGKSAEQVVTALKGYQAGTYGGAKKEIMEARAAKLSDADIGGLAALVARF